MPSRRTWFPFRVFDQMPPCVQFPQFFSSPKIAQHPGFSLRVCWTDLPVPFLFYFRLPTMPVVSRFVVWIRRTGINMPLRLPNSSPFFSRSFPFLAADSFADIFASVTPTFFCLADIICPLFLSFFQPSIVSPCPSEVFRSVLLPLAFSVSWCCSLAGQIDSVSRDSFLRKPPLIESSPPFPRRMPLACYLMVILIFPVGLVVEGGLFNVTRRWPSLIWSFAYGWRVDFYLFLIPAPLDLSLSFELMDRVSRSPLVNLCPGFQVFCPSVNPLDYRGIKPPKLSFWG